MSNKELVGFESINMNASVGMDDVVNVFISRYEDSLIAERDQYHKELVGLNEKIVEVIDRAKKYANDYVTTVVNGMSISSNLFLTGKFGVSEITANSFNWEKGVFSFNVKVELQPEPRLTLKTDNYHQSSSLDLRYPIDGVILHEYNALVTEKSKVMSKMNVVTTELRDVSRKERSVRGRIAEMKLTSMGLQDLLESPDILKLIESPNL